MRRLAGAVVSGLVLLGAACESHTVEQRLLSSFFHASRLHDRTRLEHIARVSFNPRTDGTVQRFEIVSVAGDASARDVTVAAEVRTPGGAIEPRQLVVTLQRERSDGRWVITRLRASRTSP